MNAKNLQLECKRVRPDSLFEPSLMIGSEKMLRPEKETSRIKEGMWMNVFSTGLDI